MAGGVDSGLSTGLVGRTNERVGSQNPRLGLVQGTGHWPAGRDTEPHACPCHWEQICWHSWLRCRLGEARWPGGRDAWALTAVQPRASRLPSLGLDLLFYDRDGYRGFTCFADAE